MGDVEKYLGACRFFMAVKGRSLERLVGMAVVKRFEKGEMIFREGEKAAGVFVVGRGLVRVFKTSAAGREHVLHLVGPGGTFAEVAAIGGFNVPAYAEALEETECVLLPAAEFSRALKEDHELCLQLMASMSMWVKHLVGQLEDIALRDAMGRVARYLLNSADQRDGVIRLPSLKKHLASHLNLTSETLSRTLRRLLEMGMIEELVDQNMRLLDREGMSQLAEGEFPRL